jgi:predicted transcriptional regulator
MLYSVPFFYVMISPETFGTARREPMPPCRNPNNHATRFKKGENRNPQGKTSEQKKQEYRNAEAATRLRGRMLEALEQELDEADEAAIVAVMENDPDRVKEVNAAKLMINANVLKLLKDTEDRGLGTPIQSVNIESPSGTMTPAVITRQIVDVKPNEA